MELVRFALVVWVLVTLITDCWTLMGGGKNTNKLKSLSAFAQNHGTAPATVIGIIVVVISGGLVAGTYLWLAQKWLPPLGIGLAIMNVGYAVFYLSWLVPFRLPVVYPWWWRWAIGLETIIGVPYLLYALIKTVIG